jgi:hypothetical protein
MRHVQSRQRNISCKVAPYYRTNAAKTEIYGQILINIPSTKFRYNP